MKSRRCARPCQTPLWSLKMGLYPSGLINSTRECDIVWTNHFGHLSAAVDCDGRWVKRAEYGQLSAFGWEIDHATPTIFGGLDVYANKRPRHWHGNRRAGGLINALLNADSPRYPFSFWRSSPSRPSSAAAESPTCAQRSAERPGLAWGRAWAWEHRLR